MSISNGQIQEPHGVINTVAGQKLKPASYDRYGPLYSKYDLDITILQELLANDNFFIRKRKRMSDQIKEVTNAVEAETKMFIHALDKLTTQETNLAEATKKVSGSVRKSANELGEGLLKVEKMADFNKLERYVGLLERAAVAFESLAELEKTGKLEKIALAIK
jgi:hypothetical protein